MKIYKYYSFVKEAVATKIDFSKIKNFTKPDIINIEDRFLHLSDSGLNINVNITPHKKYIANIIVIIPAKELSNINQFSQHWNNIESTLNVTRKQYNMYMVSFNVNFEYTYKSKDHSYNEVFTKDTGMSYVKSDICSYYYDQPCIDCDDAYTGYGDMKLQFHLNILKNKFK